MDAPTRETASRNVVSKYTKGDPEKAGMFFTTEDTEKGNRTF